MLKFIVFDYNYNEVGGYFSAIFISLVIDIAGAANGNGWRL
jgi:hypothetical protein